MGITDAQHLRNVVQKLRDALASAEKVLATYQEAEGWSPIAGVPGAYSWLSDGGTPPDGPPTGEPEAQGEGWCGFTDEPHAPHLWHEFGGWNCPGVKPVGGASAGFGQVAGDGDGLGLVHSLDDSTEPDVPDGEARFFGPADKASDG